MQVIKLYPRRRLRIDATEIAQFCSGFQELVQCIVIQYVNCNAPDAEKEKVGSEFWNNQHIYFSLITVK